MRFCVIQVDDLLRSGRVQFAGVPVAREASALLNLHRALVKHFEHLELHDRVRPFVVVVAAVFVAAAAATARLLLIC